MILKNILALILFTFSLMSLFGQNIILKYSQVPLNEILLDLSLKHNVQVSVNSATSNKCKITVNKTFTSSDRAIEFLSAECNLDVKKIGGIYTFRESDKDNDLQNKLIKTDKQSWLFQGLVVDATSNEPLPFSTIISSKSNFVCDANGRFSFRSFKEQEIINCRYLGYLTLDTILDPSRDILIKLNYNIQELNELVIVHSSDIYYQSSGEQSGLIKFNDIASNLIPGNASNFLFNTIRLYPGVTAAGEIASDYILWGSYPGQNNIIFDGITLFHSNGINDQIGRVNPLFVKNIELYKGGYNVNIGDRVGGIMLINGKEGNTDSLESRISINNQISNAYFNIPFRKINSTLQLGGRKTYYQIFDKILHSKTNTSKIFPLYNYTDLNLKFNTHFNNNDKFKLSIIGSEDTYDESLDKKEEVNYFRELSINSQQFGGSLSYNKNWRKGGLSTFQLSQSYFKSDYYNLSSYDSTISNTQNISTKNNIENSITETSYKFTHQFPATKMLDFFLGIGYIRNESFFSLQNDDVVINNGSNLIDRLDVFGKNNLHFGNILLIQIGLKIDIPFDDPKLFFQPRINGKINLSDKLKLTFGWGMYNQFIVQSLLTDQFGSRSYFWQATNTVNAPVLSSKHNTLGISYASTRTELSGEIYYKITNNLSQYFILQNPNSLYHSIGTSQAYGLDILFKKKIKKHEFLLAYSLGKIIEEFTYLGEIKISDAPQSQLHEIKGGILLNFSRLKLSFNQVYGSGFNQLDPDDWDISTTPYFRSDIAMNYNLVDRKAKVNLGFSVLNLFNTKNNRLDHFASFPDGSVTHSSGIPFTPTLNLSIEF